MCNGITMSSVWFFFKQFQIVVCQNVSTRKGMVQGVLTHEMIHMFDYCRNELDFRNMEHLACTEIRAANLTHCSFTSAWSQGDASLSKIKEAHQVISLIFIYFFTFIYNYIQFIYFLSIKKTKYLSFKTVYLLVSHFFIIYYELLL